MRSPGPLCVGCLAVFVCCVLFHVHTAAVIKEQKHTRSTISLKCTSTEQLSIAEFASELCMSSLSCVKGEDIHFSNIVMYTYFALTHLVCSISKDEQEGIDGVGFPRAIRSDNC